MMIQLFPQFLLGTEPYLTWMIIMMMLPHFPGAETLLVLDVRQYGDIPDLDIEKAIEIARDSKVEEN